MHGIKQLQSDPAIFRESLLIEPHVCFGDVCEGWQALDFMHLDKSWKKIAGHDVDGNPLMRAFLERPRGHSKSTDLAISCVWVLFSSLRRLRGFAAAADRDQANILKDHMGRLIHLNPWLSEILEVQRTAVVNKHTGSRLEILTSDAPSSYGLLADFIVVDELVHHSDDALWNSLFSTAAKKRDCLLLVITNAGFQDSWQFNLRENVRHEEGWFFSRLDGPTASWIDKDRLEEQLRLTPKIHADRLWFNVWVPGSGDALERDDIRAAITLNGPTYSASDEYVYFAGLDLGLRRDHSALVLIGKHVGACSEQVKEPFLTDRQRMLIETGLVDEPQAEVVYVESPATDRLKLISIDTWEPGTDSVNIQPIERRILELNERFPLVVGCDPWQSEYLMQRLRSGGVAVESMGFTPVNLNGMCTQVLQAFGQRRIDLFEHEQLIADLQNLRIEQKSYGLRLESPRTKQGGHGDIATALAIALQTASDASARPRNTGTLIAW